MTNETKFIGGISLLTLAILIAGVFFLSKNDPVTKVLSSADNAVLMRNTKHKITSDTAKLTLVEFADFECPACAAAHPLIKQVLEKYKGEVTFIYRHFPLAQHKYARLAARASEAAGEQGKFWEMYDLLYENQAEWSESDNAKSLFISYAKTLNLNVDTFTNGLDSDKFDDSIQLDFSDGAKLGVNSTPTFFLNGNKLQLRSFADLESTIDEELKNE